MRQEDPMRSPIVLLALAPLAAACGPTPAPNAPSPPPAPARAEAPAPARGEEAAKVYATVRLTADVAQLTADERRMLGLLIRAAQVMDDLFWQNSVGDKAAVLAKTTDPALRRLLEINYGPWDRLGEDSPL